jgi:hypothetical protein
VSVRYIAFAVFAVLVMGMGVYLFFEVRSSPAAPQARAPDNQVATTDEPAADDDKPSQANPADRRSLSSLRNTARKAAGDAGTTSTASVAPSVPATEEGAVEKLEGPKLDAVMAEANRSYDKMEFDEARSIAQKVLKQHPTNSRMLRIMTSSYCIENDQPEAQKYFNLLPGADREQMKTRCARYGVTFTEPPVK